MSENGEALVDRLALIEEQPLAERAAAYTRLADELRDALDSSDQR